MEGYILVDTIHLNKFKDDDFDITSEEMQHVRDDMKITLDGHILAVKRDKVEPYLYDDDIKKIRMGYQKMPKYFEIKTEDDFWRCMAHLVDIEDI